MMTNKLILIALILCVSSSVSSLKLENICKDDVFEYNGLEVNSLYIIPQHINFPSVGSFCFNETDVHFPNEADQLEFESIKRRHTDTIVGLLSEKYFNERSIVPITYRLDDTRLILSKLKDRLVNLWIRNFTDHYDKLLKPIKDLIQGNIYFVYLLSFYYFGELPNKDNLNSGIKKEEEMKKLGDLIRNLDLSNKNQTMAFNNVKIDEIYKKSIVKPYNFTLNRRSKLINDFKSTSTLYYDVVLPFHNKNYDPTSTDCKQKQDLPMFFQIREQ